MIFEWKINSKKNGFFEYLLSIPKYTRLIFFSSQKILEQQYQKSFLGRSWLFLKPLVHMLLYAIVFSMILKIQTDPYPYILFLFSGKVLWLSFAISVMWQTRSLDIMSKFSKNMYFPKIIILIGGLAPGFLQLFITSLIFLITSLLYLFIFDFNGFVFPNIFLIILCFLLLNFFSFSICLFFSIFDSFGRDMRYTLNFLMQGWMFMTPIVYDVNDLPKALEKIIFLNPLTPIVSSFRKAIFNGYNYDLSNLIYTFVVTLIIFIAGVIFFYKFERVTNDSF